MAAITLDIGGNTRQLDRDIQKTVNKVYSINLKTKGDQPLGRITGKVNEFTKSLDASNARVIAFGASAGIIYGLERAFTALVSSTIEVQKSLQDINVILNTSTDQLNKFGAELFNIAKNTGQTFQEVAKAATEFSRQGLGLEETLKRTNDALILSRLSGLDAAKSVEALTAAVNSFASQAVTASDIVNKFATVDAAFAVSSADLAEAISRVGSSAAQSGVNLNELIAIVTSAQQTTARGGAVIGNSFKTIFTRLERGKVQDLLGSLGISSTDSSGRVKSTIQLLQELGSVYDTLGSQQKAYVAEQVGGVFQINILKAALADLGKEYSIYNSALNVAAGATDQAIRRNEELNKTYAAQINALQENARQLAAAGGQRILGPTIDRLVGGTNTLLQGFSETDGQSVGAVLGKGILDGIGQFIAGPGLALVGGVLLKLFRDLAKFATGSVQQLLGLNTAATQQQALQTSIQQILAKNPQLIELALKGEQGLNTAANQLLANLQKQTIELQKQAEIATQISKAFVSQAGVRMSGGIPVAPAGKAPKTKSGGFIPNFSAQKEISGIKKSRDYTSSQKRKAAGDIRYDSNFPGLGKVIYNGQESIVPSEQVAMAMGYPAGTKPKNPAEKYSILTPAMQDNLGFASKGFIPNFANENNFYKSQKKFAAGKVFDNAIALSLKLKNAYYEDKDVIDFPPNTLSANTIDKQIKEQLGINRQTLYGDAKLSDSESNRASYISKIIRIGGKLTGDSQKGYTVTPPSMGGSILIPGAQNAFDRRQNLRAGVGAILKKNPSLEGYFASKGIGKGSSVFLPNVLIDTVSGISNQTLFGNVAGKDTEGKYKDYTKFGVRASAAESIASRFKRKASGFIPNFAQTKNPPIQLGDLDTIPNKLGKKVLSLIYPGISEGYVLRPATASYLKQQYTGNIPVAGINQQKLKSQLPDLDKNIGNLLVKEANQFGQALGGFNFLKSPEELPNYGAAKGAVGVAFEGGVQTLLQQKVGKQNAGIDFRNITPRLRSIFNNAPGIYDAKRSPELTNEVLQKLLNETKPGATVQKTSGKAGADYLKRRSEAVDQLRKEGITGSVAIRQALKDRFGIVGKAAGFIPNFAAPLVRAIDDNELRMMLSNFGKGYAFKNMSADTSAMNYGGGAGTYMWDAFARPNASPMSDRQAYKQNIRRGKNWSDVRGANWLVRFNRDKLLNSELLPDMETSGASVYSAALNKDQIIWPIQNKKAGIDIYEKDIPAFLSGQINDAIKRETEAGIPKNKIYLAQEKALTSANPMGLGVFNTRDERNKTERQTAMRRKGFAKGFIPNFAIEDTDTQGASIETAATAIIAQLSAIGFAFAFTSDQYKNSLKELTQATKTRAKEELKQSRLEAKRLEQRGLGNFAGIAREEASQRFRQTATPGLMTKGKAFLGANTLGLSIAAPILGETIKNIAGQETKTQRGIGESASALGQIGSFAATGALIAPGPVGAGVGAAIGALLTIPSAVNAFTSELPDLAAAAKKASQDLTKFSDTSQRLLTASSSLNDLTARGASSDKIKKVQDDFAKALFELTPAERARIQSSIKLGKLEEELAKITQERINDEKSKVQSATLQDIEERKKFGIFAGGFDTSTKQGKEEAKFIQDIFTGFFTTGKDTSEGLKSLQSAASKSLPELEKLKTSITNIANITGATGINQQQKDALTSILESALPETKTKSEDISRLVNIADDNVEAFLNIIEIFIKGLKEDPKILEESIKTAEKKAIAEKELTDAQKQYSINVENTISSLNNAISTFNTFANALDQFEVSAQSFAREQSLAQAFTLPKNIAETVLGPEADLTRRAALFEKIAQNETQRLDLIDKSNLQFREAFRGNLNEVFAQRLGEIETKRKEAGDLNTPSAYDNLFTEIKQASEKFANGTIAIDDVLKGAFDEKGLIDEKAFKLSLEKAFEGANINISEGSEGNKILSSILTEVTKQNSSLLSINQNTEQQNIRAGQEFINEKILLDINRSLKVFGGTQGFLQPSKDGIIKPLETLIKSTTDQLKAQRNFEFGIRTGALTSFGTEKQVQNNIGLGRNSLNFIKQLQDISGGAFTPDPSSELYRRATAGLTQSFENNIKNLNEVLKNPKIDEAFKAQIQATLDAIGGLGSTRDIAQLQIAQETGAAFQSSLEGTLSRLQDPAIADLKAIDPDIGNKIAESSKYTANPIVNALNIQKSIQVNILDLIKQIKDKVQGNNTKPQTPSVSVTAPPVDNKAKGYLPALNKESRAISRGVGGAKAGDRPQFIPNLNGMPAFVNTGEMLVDNYGGSGKTAVLTRDMQKAMVAARGFIPNFADGSQIVGAESFKEFQAKIIQDQTDNGKDYVVIRSEVPLDNSWKGSTVNFGSGKQRGKIISVDRNSPFMARVGDFDKVAQVKGALPPTKDTKFTFNTKDKLKPFQPVSLPSEKFKEFEDEYKSRYEKALILRQSSPEEGLIALRKLNDKIESDKKRYSNLTNINNPLGDYKDLLDTIETIQGEYQKYYKQLNPSLFTKNAKSENSVYKTIKDKIDAYLNPKAVPTPKATAVTKEDLFTDALKRSAQVTANIGKYTGLNIGSNEAFGKAGQAPKTRFLPKDPNKSGTQANAGPFLFGQSDFVDFYTKNPNIGILFNEASHINQNQTAAKLGGDKEILKIKETIDKSGGIKAYLEKLKKFANFLEKQNKQAKNPFTSISPIENFDSFSGSLESKSLKKLGYDPRVFSGNDKNYGITSEFRSLLNRGSSPKTKYAIERTSTLNDVLARGIISGEITASELSTLGMPLDIAKNIVAETIAIDKQLKEQKPYQAPTVTPPSILPGMPNVPPPPVDLPSKPKPKPKSVVPPQGVPIPTVETPETPVITVKKPRKTPTAIPSTDSYIPSTAPYPGGISEQTARAIVQELDANYNDAISKQRNPQVAKAWAQTKQRYRLLYSQGKYKELDAFYKSLKKDYQRPIGQNPNKFQNQTNFAQGFIPNFAQNYISNLANLESDLSGKDAVLGYDKNIGMFMRNKGQSSNLNSLIAKDHPEGLNAAMRNSMKMQKSVGVMNKGFIPNFAVTDQSFTQLESSFNNNTSALTALNGGIETLNSTLSNFGANINNNQQVGAQTATNPQGQTVGQPNVTTTTNAPVNVVVNAQGGDIGAAVGQAVQNAIPKIIEKVRIIVLGEKVPPQVDKK